MRIFFNVALAAVAVHFAAGRVHAGTMTFSGSAPTPGTYDQYDFNTTDAGGQDSQGFKLEPGRPADGQTFLVPSGATGAQLNSFSLKLLSYGDGGTDRTFDAQIVQLAGGTATANQVNTVTQLLADDTATVPAGTGPIIDPDNSATTQWLTFTFDAAARPILTAGAVYGFTLQATDSGGGKYGDLAYTVETDDDNNAGKSAFSIDTGQSPPPDEYAYGRPYDRQFEANIIAVTPEPATLSAVGISTLALLARRRVKR